MRLTSALARLLEQLLQESGIDLTCSFALAFHMLPISRRWWIEKWILEKSPEVRPRQGTGVISPMGHGILSHTKLVSNQTVRRLANQWREKNVKMD